MGMTHFQVTLPLETAGKRLDQVLAELMPEYSRSRWQLWIKAGYVTSDHQACRPRDKIQGGETIQIRLPKQPTTETEWTAQAIPLDLLYEDEALLVINKPQGLVVHPAAGNPDNTLANALLHHVPALATIPRAGVIHRLDKDTSGLLVVAKTLPAHTALTHQLQQRLIKREYEAIVCGQLIAGGTIEAPIARHPSYRQRMAVMESGKPAITHYRIKERFRAHTRLQIQLETGRTHQIRVHFNFIHHPLVGDPVYGKRLQLPPKATDTLIAALRQFKRQALHAIKLGLTHPVSGEYMEWQAPLPDDLQNLLQALREDTQHYERNERTTDSF